MSAPTNRSIQKVKGNPYDGPVMWEVQRNVGKMAKLTQDSFAFWTVQLENYLACLPKAVDILLGHIPPEHAHYDEEIDKKLGYLIFSSIEFSPKAEGTMACVDGLMTRHPKGSAMYAIVKDHHTAHSQRRCARIMAEIKNLSYGCCAISLEKKFSKLLCQLKGNGETLSAAQEKSFVIQIVEKSKAHRMLAREMCASSGTFPDAKACFDELAFREGKRTCR